jgi:hypothetical protein
MPGRRSEPGAPAEPSVALGPDAEQQAAWDADGARSGHRRRLAVLALGLAALLVVGVLVVARARGEGDILALGSSPMSSTIPPLENLDPLTGDPLFEGSQVIAPGDPAVPGAGAVIDPATGAPVDTAAPAAGGGQTGATGGTSDGSGSGSGSGVAGGGIPTPTTRPSTGGGATTTTAPAASTTTTVPGQPPPPPSCTVTGSSVSPNPVGLRGQSGKLDSNLRVEFRPTAPCGTSFRVQVNGLDLVAGSGGGGLFVATISGDSASWSRGTYPIAVKITGGTTIATIQLTVT